MVEVSYAMTRIDRALHQQIMEIDKVAEIGIIINSIYISHSLSYIQLEGK